MAMSSATVVSQCPLEFCPPEGTSVCVKSHARTAVFNFPFGNGPCKQSVPVTESLASLARFEPTIWALEGRRANETEWENLRNFSHVLQTYKAVCHFKMM